MQRIYGDEEEVDTVAMMYEAQEEWIELCERKKKKERRRKRMITKREAGGKNGRVEKSKEEGYEEKRGGTWQEIPRESWQECSVPGWEVAWSSKWRQYYWWNTTTRETSWEKPEQEKCESRPQCCLPEWWHTATLETSWDKPATDGVVQRAEQDEAHYFEEGLEHLLHSSRLQRAYERWWDDPASREDEISTVAY